MGLYTRVYAGCSVPNSEIGILNQGICGMLCSKLGAARVTLSDFVPPILDNLALSTRRNNIDARYTSLPSLCK